MLRAFPTPKTMLACRPGGLASFRPLRKEIFKELELIHDEAQDFII